MKKKIGALLRRLLPFKLYKLIANGFIVIPAYYKTVIQDAENYLDCSLQENDKKEMMLLRKYAHIIDKGLHRKDAEPGHSHSIYILLKQNIQRFQGTEYEQDPTYQWTLSKLKLYEELQTSPETFKSLQEEVVAPEINFNQLSSLIKLRRSNRVFKERTLSEDIIEKLNEVVNWAANSCNKQPIKLFKTNNPSLAKECLKCCKGGTGFGNFIPSFWVFTADVRAYVWPSEMFLPAIDVSLGAQNVFLAATTLGISGTILSWAQKNKEEERRLRQLLKIEPEYDIIFCAVLGYAEVNNLPPQRKIK